MSTQLNIDTHELDQLKRAIERLPGEIKTKAMARAMRRMTEMAKTQVTRRSASHTKLPPSVVRALTTARLNAGSSTIEVIEKSGWIPLYKLGAKQTKLGVNVKMRGSYKSAFLAATKSGHKGVFENTGEFNEKSKRHNAIRELFGPNPAHAINESPEVYIEVLANLIQEHLAPRLLHEVERLIPSRP